MSERPPTHCPDCGRPVPEDVAECPACSFPLATVAPVTGAGSAPTPPPNVAPEPLIEVSRPGPPPTVRIDPAIPRPPRRPPRAAAIPPQALSLWLIFGAIMALVVICVGVRGFRESNQVPVPGSNAGQQARADSLQRVIAADSTNVAARVRFGDVLYDTGNWSDAIIQYRAAVRMDSSLATAIVDMGVCFYNLGDSAEAERLFELALKRDAHQPVALFNLGIILERRKEYRAALGSYHRALQSDPPEGMKSALVDAMARVQKELGATPPPLPDGH
ncbi:MAG: tetratricopeptide repeat protein [Candidatus Eisenbacteria bacterium]|uniref:Tetratricopeptide repeat protein n=1 Tax=Eiseniibacteriota bacterium TaxID=2212470 RepID=A0A849SNU6_UNCEI|nr:tetratricopeptide repeat protein [Candidatus Eisenbacteria bacterium]